jgi:hypothetical protein
LLNVDPEEFGSSFMAWWIAIQPDWRVQDDGSFNYEVPEDEEWSLLCKTGKAGLVTVLVALSWWVRALTPNIPPFRVWTAVHDVKWVIDQISAKVKTPAKESQHGKKRQVDEIAPYRKSKRYVQILYIIKNSRLKY